MYTLPQGCSAKREIIRDECGFVQKIYFHTVLVVAGWGTDEKPERFSLMDKGAARFPEGEGAAPMLKNNSAEGSLFWQHGIFHSLADAELQCSLGGNLNGFTGCGIAAFSGLSLGFYELSESWENKLTVRLHFARCEISDLLEEFLHLRSLHSCGFREVVDYFRLGHALRACRGFGRHSLV